MILDSKAISLYITALIIAGVGVLVSKGLLDAGTQTLIMGMLTGGAATGAAGYALGRSANKATEQEKAVLELDRLSGPNGEPPNP